MMRNKKTFLLFVIALLILMGLTACAGNEAGKEYSFIVTNDADFTVLGIYLQEKEMMSNITMLYQDEIFPGQSVEISGVLPEGYSKKAFSINAKDFDGDYTADIDGNLSEIAQLMIAREAEAGLIEFAYHAEVQKPSANVEIAGIMCNFTLSNHAERGIDEIWLQAYGSKVRTALISEELAAGKSINIANKIPENVPSEDWMIFWSDELDNDVNYNWESCYPDYLRDVYVFWDEQSEEFKLEFVYNEGVPNGDVNTVITAAHNQYIGEWASDVATLIIHKHYRWELLGVDTDEFDEAGSYSIEDDGMLTLSREDSNTYYEATINSGELTLAYSGGGVLEMTRKS